MRHIGKRQEYRQRRLHSLLRILRQLPHLLHPEILIPKTANLAMLQVILQGDLVKSLENELVSSVFPTNMCCDLNY